MTVEPMYDGMICSIFFNTYFIKLHFSDTGFYKNVKLMEEHSEEIVQEKYTGILSILIIYLL